MKKLITMLLLAQSAVSVAQTFPTEKIISSGPDDKRIKFVILGDGYLASQQDKFLNDAKVIANALFTKSPYKEYKPYFNIFAVKVPSNAQGAGSSPSNPVDNYFGSTFGVGGTDRCLFASKDQLVMNVAKANVPGYAQIFVLVNDSKYGGCGSEDFCTLSTNAQSGEIAIHESGHTYGGLADEYWFAFSNWPNQSNTNNTSTIKWSKWVGTSSIGAYAYEAPGSSYYRPHQNCEMRYLDREFCAVCRDAFVSKYHKSVNMVESYLPTDLNLTVKKTDKTDFSVQLLAPIPNTLAVNWTVNGKAVAKNVSKITVDSTLLTTGTNTVIMSVKDTTSFVRIDTYSGIITETVKWTVSYSTVGIKDIQSHYYKTGMEIHPNPVEDNFTIGIYSGAKYTNASLWLVDINGKRTALQQNINLIEGDNTINLSMPSVSQGIYFVHLDIDGVITSMQPLVKK